MSLTVRQHYIPRVYLRSWTDQDGQLNVLDKMSKKTFHPTPENMFLEKDFYEADPKLRDNELEKRFGPFEGKFGELVKFLNFVAETAMKNGEDVATALADSLNALPERANALRDFSATAYVRTPVALANMLEQLSADPSPDAAIAREQLTSPYELNSEAFDSTLQQRFRELNGLILHSPDVRFNTGDCFCLPLAWGESHSNFGYDIGRHVDAGAMMAITSSIAVIFLIGSEQRRSTFVGRSIRGADVETFNTLLHDSSERWVVIG